MLSRLGVTAWLGTLLIFSWVFTREPAQSAASYTPAEAETLSKLDQHIELLELMNRQCREVILPEMIRQQTSPINEPKGTDNE